jgi:small subunit ribosomal protein S4
LGRYIGPVCRLCRREGTCLSLKGDRALSEKCGIQRRNYPPGQHGQRRGKISDYGQQLREKQRAKRTYGMREKQFRRVFEKAERMPGITGENLLILLERRLDTVVYRLGFGATRAEARQLVNHGHVRVNGRKVDSASYLVRPGDVVDLREKSRQIDRVNEALDGGVRKGIPVWLEMDRQNYRGTVRSLPLREEFTGPAFQEHLIVELYSK